MLLQGMEMDSKYWLNEANLSKSFDLTPAIPHKIINHHDYYERLERIAVLTENGDFEELEKMIHDQDTKKLKNNLLVPIFRDIKSVIRTISYTKYYSLFKEYYFKILRFQSEVNKI